MFNVPSILIVFTSITLVGCAGVTSGNRPPTIFNRQVNYQAPIKVDTFQPLEGTGNHHPIADIFVQDLNSDGADEVIIGGRQSQPVATQNWRNFNMQLFGWNNNGQFSNETTMWFDGRDNVIIGTEPAIKFGDFNGDNHIDMYVAASTDSDSILGQTLVYTNTGNNSFTRQELDVGNIWSHDSVVFDFNKDGLDDIFSTAYGGQNNVLGAKPLLIYGVSSGTFDSYISDSAVSSSSVSVGDYLNNGSLTMIMTDAINNTDNDTKLFSWTTNDGVLTLTEISTLPPSIFSQPEWSHEAAASPYGVHGIRNLAMDFNNDGALDVIVMDRLENHTAVQFLQNNGAGTFTDVTNDVLVNYNNGNGSSNYQPKIIDINNDGLDDIFLSGPDYETDTEAYDATQVLIQTSDGKFVSSYSNMFASFYNDISATVNNSFDAGQPMQIISGPNNERYLASTIFFDDNGTGTLSFFLAKIGTTGTITPRTMADTLKNIWPYISDAEALKILSLTSPGTVNGIDIADLDLALIPVDGLGLSLTGRTGERFELTGHMNLPDFDQSIFQSISAFDGLGRDFSVDLRGLVNNATASNRSMPISSVDDIWSANLIHGQTKNGTLSTITNQYEWFNSISNFGLPDNSNWHYRVGTGTLRNNPWVSISGVFGEIVETRIADLTIGYHWNNGLWAQVGISEMRAELQQGLVQEVTPLRAMYTTAGINLEDSNVRLYAGISPILFDGAIRMKLPTAVNFNGTAHYTEYETAIKNNLIGFIGVGNTIELHDTGEIRTKVSINSESEFSMGIDYEFYF
ncbi:MAG: VCBS repeat-containing protein [Pseudomonadota bacterium]|nr:VCBS repeat-containing protein [Pseudomonadota bacterium]